MKKTVKQIIENIREYHSGLSEYFYSLKEKAADKRAELILDYLAGHEYYISNHLQNYLDDSKDKKLNRWINIVPCLPSNIFCHCRKNLSVFAPITVDDAIEIAVHYEDCLIDFLSVIAKETECSKTAEIFCNLLKKEKLEEKKLVRNSQLINDM